jgi:hypothetical protein
VAWHQQFVERLGQANQEANSVGALLSRATADRAPANRRYNEAVRLLQHITGDGGKRQPDWKELCRRLKDVDTNLDKAQRLANEDIRLARQAAAEIADAERELRSATSFYSQGVSADTHSAKNILQNAKRNYASLDFEGTIREANRAEREARDALNEAESEANRKRRRLEQEQHSRTSSHFGSGSSLFDSSGASSSHSSRSSGTSQSSWSSGTSQDSW